MPLTLYHLPTCPFCHRVRRAAAELGIELELVDVSQDTAAYDRLVRELGRGTVPVLAIPTASGERLLPESADIVHWLRRHHAAA